MFYHLQDESECGRENVGDNTNIGEKRRFIKNLYMKLFLPLFKIVASSFR